MDSKCSGVLGHARAYRSLEEFVNRSEECPWLRLCTIYDEREVHMLSGQQGQSLHYSELRGEPGARVGGGDMLTLQRGWITEQSRDSGSTSKAIYSNTQPFENSGEPPPLPLTS